MTKHTQGPALYNPQNRFVFCNIGGAYEPIVQTWDCLEAHKNGDLIADAGLCRGAQE